MGQIIYTTVLATSTDLQFRQGRVEVEVKVEGGSREDLKQLKNFLNPCYTSPPIVNDKILSFIIPLTSWRASS